MSINEPEKVYLEQISMISMDFLWSPFCHFLSLDDEWIKTVPRNLWDILHWKRGRERIPFQKELSQLNSFSHAQGERTRTFFPLWRKVGGDLKVQGRSISRQDRGSASQVDRENVAWIFLKIARWESDLGRSFFFLLLLSLLSSSLSSSRLAWSEEFLLLSTRPPTCNGLHWYRESAQFNQVHLAPNEGSLNGWRPSWKKKKTEKRSFPGFSQKCNCFTLGKLPFLPGLLLFVYYVCTTAASPGTKRSN